jgi:hypothetical protein
MNINRDFNNSIGVLVKAYFNDTLVHGQCHACAVGNLVGAARQVPIIKDIRNMPGKYWVKVAPWSNVFMTVRNEQEIDLNAYQGEAKEAIDSTGYTWQELARIEYAFETADKGSCEDDYMLAGLLAVVDVLADIHGIDLTKREEAKLLFVK